MFLPPPGNPYYALTVLHLACEGSDASTDIPDVSAVRNAVTVVGNAKLATAQKPYGESSLSLDGTGDYLTVPTTYFVLSGDFTLEAMIYVRDVRAYQAVLDGRAAATLSNYCCGVYNVSGTLYLDFVTSAGRLTSAGSVSLNTWTHIAWCRSSGIISCFIGGTKDANTYSNSSTLTPAGASVRVGAVIDPTYGYEYLKDIRLTKGVALYSANFTPPAESLPAFPWACDVRSPMMQPSFVSAARLGL